MTPEPVKITRNVVQIKEDKTLVNINHDYQGDWAHACIEVDPDTSGLFLVSDGIETITGLDHIDAVTTFIAFCEGSAESLEEEADRSATVTEWESWARAAVGWHAAAWQARRDLTRLHRCEPWVS